MTAGLIYPATALLCLSAVAVSARPLVLVSEQQSPYVIYREADAPEPVQEAARELSRVVEAACQVALPIVDEPQEPMISLGDNPAAREAGFSAEEMTEESFLIASAGDSLYILGPDTPDGELTADGGCSQGTLFGVYEFLEHFLNVRWLLPGEVGEDIPECGELRVDGLPISDAPDHPYRNLPYIQNERPEVQAWARRMRMGEALPDGRRGCAQWMSTSHVWERVLDPAEFLEHPEYTALVNGERVKPEGRSFKLCTTNPALVEAFAAGIIRRIEANPQARMHTISPTDGQGWCECGNCTALDEPVDAETWPGSAMLQRNMTRRLCTFYNAVAKIVGRSYPDKLLGGFLYYEYAYPPTEPIEMEPNLYFMLATRAYYGMGLYRPALAEELPRLFGAWTDALPGRVAYYDLPTKLIPSRMGFVGAPQPAGVTILSSIFPAVKEQGIRGILLYGDEWWGTAGAHNYIIARLIWDNEADPAALRDEWLARAYGPSAAEPMRELDEMLDTQLSELKQNPDDWQWRFPIAAATGIYAPSFPGIERLYLDALAKAETPRQRERLEMFGDNLRVLHWNLRKADLLPDPEQSALYLSDDQYAAFVAERGGSLALYTGSGGAETLLLPRLAPGDGQ